MLIIFLLLTALIHSRFGFSILKAILTSGVIFFILSFAVSFLSYNLYDMRFYGDLLRMAAVPLALISGFWYFQSDSRYIRQWLKQGYIDEIDSDQALDAFADLTKNSYKYQYENIPYGRAAAFLSEFEDIDFSSVRYLGYNPIRSKDKIELREYGMLVTNVGIFLKSQDQVTSKNPETKKKTTENYSHPIYLPFSGLWSLIYNQNQEKASFKYADGSYITIDFKEYPINQDFLSELDNFIYAGVTRNILLEEKAAYYSEEEIQSADQQVQEAYQNLLRNNKIGLGAYQGFLTGETIFNKSPDSVKYNGSKLNSVSKHAEDIQLNRIASARHGHGDAAEYANNTIDKLKGYTVESSGSGYSNLEERGQGVNAFDRERTHLFTGRTESIQTKYCRTGKDCADSFLKGNYPEGTILEVPKGMKKATQDTLGENSNVKVIEGSVTYEWALAMTKAGTIPSLTIDFIDGVIMSTTGASITFIFSYTQARHLGLDRKEAVKQSSISSLKTLGAGTLLHMGSKQFAKTELAKGIAKKLGIDAVKISGYATMTISTTLIYGPSITDCLRGRISVQQLVKNSAIAAAGQATGYASATAASKIVGGTLGSVAGPAASIAGSMAGGYVAGKVFDKFIKDDSEECFHLFKEEFIDYLYSIELDEKELQKLIDLTFSDKHFNSRLKDIYKAGRKLKDAEKELAQRTFIRVEILEPAVIPILREREPIAKEEIIQAIKESDELLSSLALSAA